MPTNTSPFTTTPDPFDSLADLFLGDSDQGDPTSFASSAQTPRRDQATTRPIETRGLIVGHLPVIASAWVAQHARDLAKQLEAPVAILSRSPGRVALDLQGLEPHQRPTKADSLDDAIKAATNAGIGAWLIRTDAITELALAELTALDALTILTGHDEAAVVAAYRALKGLTSTTSNLEPVVPALHLAVMGANHDQGRPAAERLRRAAASFLETGLASVNITHKVGTGSAARLFEGECDTDIDQLIQQLPKQATTPTHRPTHASTRAPTQPSTHPAAATDPHAERQGKLRLTRGDSDHASRIGPVETHQHPNDAEQTAPVGSETQIHNQTHTQPHTPSMHTHRPEALAPLLGLSTLDPRCPYADEVELAADAEGRAHLIIHAEGATHSLANALESLEIARAWLAAHVTILAAATQNAIRTSPPLDPASHLVVDHAAGARRLLDSQTRLYVLAKGRAETICVPLN
ncbi:MAG: hypothetical protein AAFR96_07920 [Planctomycetota bacterium]